MEDAFLHAQQAIQLFRTGSVLVVLKNAQPVMGLLQIVQHAQYFTLNTYIHVLKTVQSHIIQIQ